MLHIPVNTILTAPQKWRQALGLPDATVNDWNLIREIDKDINGQCKNGFMESLLSRPGKALATEMHELASSLSFFAFLEERMLSEAGFYMRYGTDALMLENVAGPYFIKGRQPIIIYSVMSALAHRLREVYPLGRLGIQILAFSDNLAMEIAVRSGFEFVRSESALFSGIRPEGYNPNHGNLAQLYMLRNCMLADLERDDDGPQVFVDLQKKHTMFADELTDLDIWLENILFQKLEGIIITGSSTGSPVREKDLKQARTFLDTNAKKTRQSLGFRWCQPLIAGSGVSTDNIEMCRKYTTGVIVGSSLKQGGYWECPLDEERLKRFADKWHAGSK